MPTFQIGRCSGILNSSSAPPPLISDAARLLGRQRRSLATLSLPKVSLGLFDKIPDPAKLGQVNEISGCSCQISTAVTSTLKYLVGY